VPVEIASEIPPIQTPSGVHKDILRLGIYGGYSWMTGVIPDDMEPILADHLKRLKNGFHIGADLNVFVNRFLALGVKYSLFRTNDEVNNIIFTDYDGNQILGKISENLFVHYIAPSIFLKAGKNTGKVFFIFDGSMGCLIYRNNATFVQTDAMMKGATFGVSIAPGIEIRVTPSFAVNLNLGLTVGTLNTITITGGGTTEVLRNAKENISRLDVSIGLRWYKQKHKKI
jgi:hypothetical protein